MQEYIDPDAEKPRTGSKISERLAKILAPICQQEDGRLQVEAQKLGQQPAMITRFHAPKAPPYSVEEYMKRLEKYFFCSSECYILAFIYIVSSATFLLNYYFLAYHD